MVNYFIYAKDCSGSTCRVEHYHSNGLKTFEQFKKDVEKIKEDLLNAGEPPTESIIVYLQWGDNCSNVTEDEIRTAYLEQRCGWMNTKPEYIIRCLKRDYILDKSDKIKLMYIITDGLIDSQSVNECFRENKDMHYEKVVFHAFNEDLREIDLSVATSFFKSQCEVYRNYELYDSTDISKDFNYDLLNVDNFEVEKEQLKSYIKLKYINKFKHNAGTLQEIDKLKKLRNRLFEELSMKELNSEKCYVNLDTKDRKIFLSEFINSDWYKSLSVPVYVIRVDIEKSIMTLINYIVSDAKSYSFDALKFDTKFNKSVEDPVEEIVDVNFTAQQEIEFPDVILDDEKGVPVVILTEFNLLDKIIFHKTREPNEIAPASFSKFRSTMECPLFLVNDKDVSESIGYFYTYNVYKQLLGNDMKTDPRTRKPFHGGLVLTETDQFDKYNDYILSATYFDFKKINYNVGLFYFVLWKNCENKEWMDRNVVERFKKYAMRRISETVCKIGLSSLPLDPQENTSLPTALWYCVEMSSCIFKNDPQLFHQERLRKYHGVAHYMVEILKYFNYDLDLNSIEKRSELLSFVMVLKKIHKRREKVYYLLEKIFKSSNGFLVSEIENPSNLYKLNYLKLNHKEMLRDDVVEEKVHLNDYVHLMHSEADKATFEFCEKTFRPFFAIERNRSFYTELVKNTRRVVINNDDDMDKIEIAFEAIDSLEFDRIMSLYRLFINFVTESEKYPTLPEYIEYIVRKKKFKEDLITVFSPNVDYYVKNVYDRYQKVVKEVSVSDFIKVCKNNVARTERIKAEEKVKFSNDNEIAEFITSEESKVNLKKRTQ